MCARYQSSPKKFHLIAVKKNLRYLSGSTDLGLWYLAICKIELISYSDANYARCKLDRKSTSTSCQFISWCLVSWVSKKQYFVALSTVEVEYVIVGSYAAQVLWIKSQLNDYYIDLGCIPILCDNTSAINLSKNSIQHSRIKYIEIRHHFLRDEVTKNNIELYFIKINK